MRRRERAVEDRQVLVREPWRALDRVVLVDVADDRVDLRTVFIRALEGYLGVPPKPITRRGRSEER